MSSTDSFRTRLHDGAPLVGTWVKTPSHIIADVLGLTALDCVCFDAEHAPFDRTALDVSLSAMCAAGMPSLVRVPASKPEYILNTLDCGATGIVAPHITSAEDAAALAKACRFGAGGRGYAGSTRAAGYTTTPMAQILQSSKDETAVIAQIEDVEAVEDIDAIAQVEGIDCLFVGRVDLTVALGADTPSDQSVVDAVQTICAAGQKHNRRVGMFLGDLSEIPMWRDAGASLFIVKSDHSFILEGAARLRKDFDQFNVTSTP